MRRQGDRFPCLLFSVLLGNVTARFLKEVPTTHPLYVYAATTLTLLIRMVRKKYLNEDQVL